MDKRNLPQPTQTSNFSAIQSSLNHMEALYIQKKKQVELLQVEVQRLSNKADSLEFENARLEKIIDGLHNSINQRQDIAREFDSICLIEEYQPVALFVGGV